MLNLSPVEVMVILVVALVVLGPNRLPAAARQVGRALSELQRVSAGFRTELRDAFGELEDDGAARRAPAPSADAPDAADAARRDPDAGPADAPRRDPDAGAGDPAPRSEPTGDGDRPA